MMKLWTLGTLLLAYVDPDGRLIYAGRAGTGIKQAELELLWRILQPLATVEMPLEVPPPRTSRFGSPLVLSRVHWVRPELRRRSQISDLDRGQPVAAGDLPGSARRQAGSRSSSSRPAPQSGSGGRSPCRLKKTSDAAQLNSIAHQSHRSS